jgi:hypothetical protein
MSANSVAGEPVHVPQVKTALEAMLAVQGIVLDHILKAERRFSSHWAMSKASFIRAYPVGKVLLGIICTVTKSFIVNDDMYNWNGTRIDDAAMALMTGHADEAMICVTQAYAAMPSVPPDDCKPPPFFRQKC